MRFPFKLIFAAAGIALSAAASAATLSRPIPAPEFAGIDKWLNSDPLTIQQLRGKVVLVDFWTYTCINCINTLPYVKSWHAKYKDQGLVVVGVHTPEYPFERNTDNVRTAIKRFDIKYPVAQDNRYTTWSAYNNQFWPAVYLIDKKGQVVYTHFGEGQYAQTEAAIQALLAQK
jgi:thiol-disulfide isomerase/thioredoxin